MINTIEAPFKVHCALPVMLEPGVVSRTIGLQLERCRLFP